VNNRDIPDICLQHLVAVMLIDGTVSFHAAHDVARMQDASVLRQRGKVELAGDRSSSAGRRAGRRSSPLRFRTAANSASTCKPCAGPPTTRCRAARSLPNAAI